MTRHFHGICRAFFSSHSTGQLLSAIILLAGSNFCYFSWSSFSVFSFSFFFGVSARYEARRVTRDNYVDSVFASRAKENIPLSLSDVVCNYDREKV